jgi:hypothetical protein
MSHTCRLLFFSAWTLLAALTGCGPPAIALDTGALDTAMSSTPPGPQGWAVDPRDPDHAWRWGAGEIRVSVADTDIGDRTRGLWIEIDDVPVAARLPSGQSVPLVIAGTRTDGTPPLLRIDGDRLVLALAGSTEHGCPRDALALAVDVDPERGRLHLLVAGVPYILLDAEPVLIAGEGGARAAVLPGPGQSWTSDRVRTAWGRVGGRPVGLAFRASPPWLQLQRHGPALEMDLDHGCEEPSFNGSFLSIQVPL